MQGLHSTANDRTFRWDWQCDTTHDSILPLYIPVFTYNYERFVLATLAIAVTVYGTVHVLLASLQYYGMRRIR